MRICASPKKLQEACMEKKEREAHKREAIFTVRDAESAVVTYTVLLLLYIVGICIYKWSSGWDGVLAALTQLDENYPRFNRTAIAWIVFKEGVDIMFRRYKEWRVEHAQNLEKARAAGIAEGIEKGIEKGVEKGIAEGMEKGIAEGMEKGITEGKVAVYQEVAAWNARRLEAEAKGIPFNEPPPSNGTG